jgi:branched-chain amino acid transport system ATP-binding protein
MLEVKNLFAGYGTLPVLRDVSFDVAPGEIVLIAGENGAGKSTLLRSIAGLLRPSRGQVTLQGKSIEGQLPEQIVASGLRLVLDGHQVFPELSVFDNLRLGATVRRPTKAEFDADVAEVLKVFPILEQKFYNAARDLSGGQQQMLALGQAFVAKPKVLLCDEPSTGLAIALLPPIMNFLRGWAKSGTSVVLVEQHIDLALEVADRAMLMERGALRFSCPPSEFKQRLVAA